MNATDFLTSNYYRAEDLESGVCIEAIVVSARPHEFEDGETKLVLYLNSGKGLVMNQTRLKAMISAFGPNFDNWVGRQINITRGPTMYAGKPTWAIVIEPVVAERIAAAAAKPALEQPRHGSVDIGSGKGARDRPTPSDRAPDPDLDDQIPF